MTKRELNNNLTENEALKSAVYLTHYFNEPILISNRDLKGILWV